MESIAELTLPQMEMALCEDDQEDMKKTYSSAIAT